MKFNLGKKTLLFFAAITMFISCEKEVDSLENQTVSEALVETPITDHIVGLGFRKSGIKDMGDYYTVEEDSILFKKETYDYLNSVTKKNQYVDKGSKRSDFQIALHRYYHRKNGDHFYTTNFNELGYGDKKHYKYQGIECYVPSSTIANTQPLYRYYNRNTGDHFYTIYYSELGGGDDTFKYEGIQCYTFKNPTGIYKTPLRRFFNGRDHMYASSQLGFAEALNPIYFYYYLEGNVGYVQDNYNVKDL